MEEERLTAYKVHKMFPQLLRETVNARFVSKYAKERWGIEEGFWPNGKPRRYLPKDKLYLWEEGNLNKYVGRPKKED